MLIHIHIYIYIYICMYMYIRVPTEGAEGEADVLLALEAVD